MKIIVARQAGFCFGVRRALDRMDKAIAVTGGSVYSLGPIIHNRQVIARLTARGVRTVDTLDDIPAGPVFIRTHGVGPQDYAAIHQRHFAVVDATCPFVKRAQRLARQLAGEGYQVVVVGERKHPEVRGIVGWTGGQAWVVENPAEAASLPWQKKIGVVAQTTQPEEVWRQVVAVLQTKAEEVKVFNTICQATRQRQAEARQLAERVDVMVVVGGYDSANTRKLVQVCQEAGTPAYQVESAADLRKEWFHGASQVGVTAGASTPDWIIEEVVSKMQEFERDTLVRPVSEPEPGENAPEENKAQELAEESTPAEERIAVPVGQEAGEGETEAAPDQEAQSPEPVTLTAAEATSMADMQDMSELHRGDIISGTVVQVNESEVLVDVGYKAEGIIPLAELSSNKVEDPHQVVQPGDVIEVYVIRSENEEGHPVLSKRRADRKKAWERLEQAFTDQSEIQAPVVEVVKGGLLVDVGVRGFVPASLVERGYVENLQDYLGKTLRLRVIELDRSKNKVVLSQKAILEEEFQRRRQDTWNNLEEGQIYHGVVRRLTSFGAFVDIGGVDGLLHVSEISWGRIEHPSEVLKEGQEIDVKVLGVDRERGRVSLGLKQLQPNPWNTAAERYPAGAIVQGKVLRIAPFGAFVEVEPGIEGLVHISQLAERHVEKPEDVVTVGQEIPVKVLGVDEKAQRMSLSLREALREKNRRQAEKHYENDRGQVTIGDVVGDIIFEEQAR